MAVKTLQHAPEHIHVTETLERSDHCLLSHPVEIWTAFGPL